MTGRDQLLCVRAPLAVAGLSCLAPGPQLTVSGPVVSSQGPGLGDLDDSSETGPLSITERETDREGDSDME